MSGADRRGGRALIPALGVGQIVSWGTLFYSIAILGESMRAELGVPASLLFGAYTAGLVTSALLAPFSGRRVDRLGGRVVLGTGTLVAATALATLAASQGPMTLVAGYLLSGVAMSMTLYDPAFATLHRLRADDYRRAVTLLTLFGGFASTVFWPVGSALNAVLGWRGTFACFAVLHLVICLPLHLGVIPREAQRNVAPIARESGASAASANAAFYWLAASFALASLLFGAFSAHLIEVLTGGGLTLEQAVAIGACIGPMQVSGRILELAIARHTRAIHVGCVAFALIATAMILLGQVGSSFAAGIAFAVAYGMGNGILTIVRGVAPAEILGGVDVGTLLGRMARIHLPVAAFAPLLFALLRDAGFAYGQLIGACALVACLAGACFVLAARRGRPRTG